MLNFALMRSAFCRGVGCGKSAFLSPEPLGLICNQETTGSGDENGKSECYLPPAQKASIESFLEETDQIEATASITTFPMVLYSIFDCFLKCQMI